MINKLIYKFCSKSILSDLPKKVYAKKSSGFLSSFFSNNYLSETSYNLSHELFEFLLQNQYIQENFPCVQDSADIHANLMALHVALLRERMKSEGTKMAIEEADNFFYYCKTKHFLEFAESINSEIPAEDFREYYQESYSNRVNVIEGKLKEHFSNLSLNKKENEENLNKLLRKIILMNFFKLEHPFTLKLTKYYLAHRLYLHHMTYLDLVTKKINWGLQEDPKLLAENSQN
ncbi:hypothetical protein ABPG72_007269 [Tetrahymena utriculariae]